MPITRPLVNSQNVQALNRAMKTGAVTGDFLPAVYVVEPTSRCDLGCIMCPNSRLRPSDLGDVSIEQFTATLEAIAPTAELVMLYFMGESTLHPEISSLFSLARRSIRGRLVLSTNAFDLDVTTIESMCANLDVIIVCIDRWVPEVYEKIRRGSKFSRVVSNAEAILRCARRTPSPPLVIVKGLDIHLPKEVNLPTSGEAQAFASYWKQRGAVPLAGWLNSWAGQMPNLLRLSSMPTPYKPEARVPCADLWFKMVINWQGRVVLCCHNWNYSIGLGSVSQPVREVWHSPELQRLRAAHLVGDYSCTSICSGCREWGEEVELESYVRLSPEDLFRVF